MRIFGLNRRIIRVLLGSQYAHMLEYRAEIALWALSGVLPFIMLSVWSGSDARSGLGLDGVALDRYFLSAFLVRQFSVVWVVYAFEEDALARPALALLAATACIRSGVMWRPTSASSSPVCPSRR
jgi:ABC-2 type transport system permease protein